MSGLVLLRAAIGLVLLASAATKLISRTTPRPLLEAMALPPVLVRLAVLLAPAEALVGAALIIGSGTWAAVASAALAGTFAMTLAIAWRAGIREACRCFGAMDHSEITPVTVVRAMVLATAAILSCLPVHLGHGSFSENGVALALAVAAASSYLVIFKMAEELWLFERHRRRVKIALRKVRAMEVSR